MDTRKDVENRLLELCEEDNLSVNALTRIFAVYAILQSASVVSCTKQNPLSKQANNPINNNVYNH